MIASLTPSKVDEDVLTALSGVILTLAERVVQELNRGKLEQIWIQSNSGYVVVSRAGGSALLIVLAQPRAKLGLLLLDIRRAANEIAQLL